MSNYEDFMKALRAERQHELRVAQAQGLTQRHQRQPDTRLVPLPPQPAANFFPTHPHGFLKLNTICLLLNSMLPLTNKSEPLARNNVCLESLKE